MGGFINQESKPAQLKQNIYSSDQNYSHCGTEAAPTPTVTASALLAEIEDQIMRLQKVTSRIGMVADAIAGPVPCDPSGNQNEPAPSTLISNLRSKLNRLSIISYECETMLSRIESSVG